MDKSSWVLLALPHIADAVTIAGFLAVIFQLRASEAARMSQDIISTQATVLSVLSSLELAKSSQERRLYLVNSIGLFESIATLINSRSLSSKARKLWQPYLASMLERVSTVSEYRECIRSERYSHDTYGELRKFRANNIKLFKRDDVVAEAIDGPIVE